MAKRQQAWVGIAVGSVGLLALFGVLYALSGGSNVALDGDQVTSAVPDAGSDENADVLGDVTMSDTDGDVSSFGADADNTGLALRVVTDGSATGSAASDAATTSSSSSTTASTVTTAGSETSSTTAATGSSSTAPTTASSSTTKPPAPAEETTTTKDPTSSSTSTTVVTSTTATTATTAVSTTVSDSGSDARSYEQEVIRLTNEERSAGGCGPLTNNGNLHAAALAHSVDMAENDYFSHTSRDGSSMVDRVERQGYRWRSLAENIAAGYRSPAAVVEGWMNSSGHRANIMNCSLTEIGVGFHSYYWTQNFGTPR